MEALIMELIDLNSLLSVLWEGAATGLLAVANGALLLVERAGGAGRRHNRTAFSLELEAAALPELVIRCNCTYRSSSEARVGAGTPSSAVNRTGWD